MNREQLFRTFFIGVFLFLAFQLLRILSPFYAGILGAVVLDIIFFPMHRWVLRGVGEKRASVAAFLTTFLTALLILIPLAVFGWMLAGELRHLYPTLRRMGETLQGWRAGQTPPQAEWFGHIQARVQEALDITEIELQNILVNVANKVLDTLANLGRKLARNALLYTVNALVMIFTQFFLFRDGPSFLRKLKEIIPMDPKDKDHVVHQVYLTLNAVVRGVFIVALTQGVLAGLGFALAGVPSPVALGLCTMAFALIPFVGTPAVWLPAALYYLAKGDSGRGVFLLLWGTLVVSLFDNFLRPVLIGTKARLPVLLLFFGLLGGVKVYGPTGLFLGPLVIALLLAFVRIYREEYPEDPPQAS